MRWLSHVVLEAMAMGILHCQRIWTLAVSQGAIGASGRATEEIDPGSASSITKVTGLSVLSEGLREHLGIAQTAQLFVWLPERLHLQNWKLAVFAEGGSRASRDCRQLSS